MIAKKEGFEVWGYMLYIYKESNSRSKLGLFLMCSLNFGFAKYFVFSASTLNITSCAVVGFESFDIGRDLSRSKTIVGISKTKGKPV